MADKRPGERRVPGERFTFDPGVWREEVERFSSDAAAYRAAVAARRRIESAEARVVLRASDAVADDGTRLPACGKVYVPLDVEPSRAPFGFVFIFRARPDGELIAQLVGFGERHPEQGHSVYERAHRRLHGRYPDEESRLSRGRREG